MVSSISNDMIDKHYQIALKNGALGGKLLGAGGGGFLIFYCEPEKQERLRRALDKLDELRFKFDWSGSTVIYYGEDWNEKQGFFE